MTGIGSGTTQGLVGMVAAAAGVRTDDAARQQCQARRKDAAPEPSNQRPLAGRVVRTAITSPFVSHL